MQMKIQCNVINVHLKLKIVKLVLYKEYAINVKILITWISNKISALITQLLVQIIKLQELILRETFVHKLVKRKKVIFLFLRNFLIFLSL